MEWPITYTFHYIYTFFEDLNNSYISFQVLILNVVDASCYWVRILEHKPADGNQTSRETAYSTEFLDLTMAVSGWYADPNHRVKQELIVVGDLCCVKLENSNSFHRYLTRNMRVVHMQSYLLVST